MKKRIGILSSSRADYSIYRPLLYKLKESGRFDVFLIAFGTHLSQQHGLTVNAIEQDGFTVDVKLNCLPEDGSPAGIAQNMGQVMREFAEIWNTAQYDLVLCLGDRYEMFSAVAAALPFNIPVAHLYGGETTAGAIDDALRHSITHMSRYHFTSCEAYKNRVIELTGSDAGVYNAGALSYDNLKHLQLPEKDELSNALGVDFNRPVILTTFHPETVNYTKNEVYANAVAQALEQLTGFEVLITMPNADTMNEVIRQKFMALENRCGHIHTRENLGTLRYLAAMKHCALMLGNTSSGFVEASWFPTPVVNLGQRQKGRILTQNIVQCDIELHSILNAVETASNLRFSHWERIYGNGDSADFILSKIDEILAN
jgi:GDP/UDP-N,N'-diacetylbacillosamine 2-epimerase (hydrolysing)